MNVSTHTYEQSLGDDLLWELLLAANRTAQKERTRDGRNFGKPIPRVWAVYVSLGFPSGLVSELDFLWGAPYITSPQTVKILCENTCVTELLPNNPIRIERVCNLPGRQHEQLLPI